MKRLLIIIGIIALYCLPWMAVNAYLFGNPLFPTGDFLIPASWGVIDSQVQSQLAVNYWSMLEFFGIRNLTWMDWLGLADPAPWSGGNPRPDETGPFLLICTPLIVFVWKDLSRAGKIAICVALAYCAAWVFGMQLLHSRYMMPAFPVLCAGIGVAITKLLESDSHG